MQIIDLNSDEIKERHYVMNATASNHWYNFYSSRVNSYAKKYNGDFCLIINGSDGTGDAYILPFRVFRLFFTSDYLDQHNRWVGTIKGNRIRLTARSKRTKSQSVSDYYNAFALLDDSTQADDILNDDDMSIVADHDELQLSDLQGLIARFNRLYASARPKKRIAVSESVARPNAITDYLKKILNYTCQICRTVGFQQTNGSLFIEAHHMIALHEMVDGSYCSDNIIVVCPACHRKLHYADVSYTARSEKKIRVTINGIKSDFERNIITS
jgi:hypothetical protein